MPCVAASARPVCSRAYTHKRCTLARVKDTVASLFCWLHGCLRGGYSTAPHTVSTLADELVDEALGLSTSRGSPVGIGDELDRVLVRRLMVAHTVPRGITPTPGDMPTGSGSWSKSARRVSSRSRSERLAAWRDHAHNPATVAPIESRQARTTPPVETPSVGATVDAAAGSGCCTSSRSPAAGRAAAAAVGVGVGVGVGVETVDEDDADPFTVSVVVVAPASAVGCVGGGSGLHAVLPSPVYPSLQSQVKPPGVLLHVACSTQSWVLMAHSSISWQYMPS
jgi:hypothetical protein